MRRGTCSRRFAFAAIASILWPPVVLAGDSDWFPSRRSLGGRLRGEWRSEVVDGRSGLDADRQDADGLVWFSGFTRGLGHEQLDARVAARWEKDLDGAGDEFVDMRDERYPNRGNVRLHEANVRVRDLLGGRLSAVAGRQTVDGILWPVAIDGGRLDLAPLGPLDATAFAGTRVSFSSSPRVKGVFGGRITLRPTQWVEVTALDVMHIDNLLQLSLAAHLPDSDAVAFRAAYTFINDDAYDVSAEVDIALEEGDTSVVAAFERKLGGGDGLAFDPTSSDNGAHGRDRFRVRRLELPRYVPSDDYSLSISQRVWHGASLSASLRRHEIRVKHLQSGYETSFWEASAGLALRSFVRHLGVDAEAIWRESDRSRPRENGPFFSTFGEGETRSFEINGALSLRVEPVVLTASAYWRTFDYANRFVRLDAERAWGAQVGLEARLADAVRISVTYFFDRDVRATAPDIEASHAVWFGVEVAR